MEKSTALHTRSASLFHARKGTGPKVRQPVVDVVIRTISMVILGLFVILIIVPLLNYFSLAFNDPTYNENVIIFPIRWDFSSFAYLFSSNSEGFWKSFVNSIIITVVVTVISNLIEALAAYPLSKLNCPLRKGILMYFVITMLFSAGIVPIYLLMRSFNLLDNIWSIILCSISNVFNLLFYKSFFEGVPKEIEEAATVDGAGSLRLFFDIVVPMALPVFGSCCFFTIVDMWNGYGAALIFIKTSATDSMPLAYYLYVMMTQDTSKTQYDIFLQTHMDNIQAASFLVSIIPILLIYPYVVKYIKSGATLGSVKE